VIKIESRIQPEIFNYDVSTEFARDQWGVYRHAPIQLNREWSLFRQSLLDVDRGYGTLTDPNMGTLLVYDEWFDEFRDWGVKSAHLYPEMKVGVQLMDDVHEKIRKDLRRRVHQAEKQGGYFLPEQLPPIIDNLGREHLLLNNEIGAAGLRYAAIVKKRDIKPILEGYGRRRSLESTGMINVLDVFLDSWDGSFPPNPFAFYRLAYTIIDSYQPENQQVLPRLIYKSRGLEPPINNYPNKTIIADRIWTKLREELREKGRGQKLCPAAFLKIIAERPVLSNYSERLKEGLEDIKNRRRISKKNMYQLYQELLFTVPVKALRNFILSEPDKEEEEEQTGLV